MEYLAIKQTLADDERSLELSATSVLKNYLHRELLDQSTKNPKSKLSPKELLNETDRVLLHSILRMSLLESLIKDGKLRNEMLALLELYAEGRFETL